MTFAERNSCCCELKNGKGPDFGAISSAYAKPVSGFPIQICWREKVKSSSYCYTRRLRLRFNFCDSLLYLMMSLNVISLYMLCYLLALFFTLPMNTLTFPLTKVHRALTSQHFLLASSVKLADFLLLHKTQLLVS
jgi:hypothetical protein